MRKPIIWTYMKEGLDVLASPPKCPDCGKKMSSYAKAGFFAAIEQTINIMTGEEVSFICLNSEQNPEYKGYQDKLKEYNEKKKEVEKIMEENERRIFFKKKVPPMPTEPKPIPPQKPCKNNYKFSYKDGKIIPKKRGRIIWYKGEDGEAHKRDF